MGSNRKKKVGGSKPLVPGGEEAAASSTTTSSSSSTNHHRRNSSTRSLLVQVVLSSAENISTSNTMSTPLSDVKGLNSSTWSTDFTEALLEVDGAKSFRFSWQEIFTLGLVLVTFAGISICAGVAAGISISAHYYETQENVDLRWSSHPIAGSSFPQRVTTLDPIIASFNSLHLQDDRDDFLRRAVHTSPLMLNSVLLIAEESLMQVGSFEEEVLYDLNDGTGRNQSETINLQRRPRPPDMSFEKWVKDPPKLCSDGRTIGFDSWSSLKSAVQSANRYSAHRYLRWKEYFDTASKMQAPSDNLMMMIPFTFDDDSMYYEEAMVFTICPGAVLRAGRRPPIFINTESVVIECEGCTIAADRSHLSFGPEAKGAVVRGVAFTSAKGSSLIFHHNGADASFENCTWSVVAGKLTSMGAIAEVNSTSVVNFYRCFVNKARGRLAEWTSSLLMRKP